MTRKGRRWTRDRADAAGNVVRLSQPRLPRRQVLVCEEKDLGDFEWLMGNFAGGPWGEWPRLSHVRVLYRDECGSPTDLVDAYVPAELVPAITFRASEREEDLDLIERGGRYAKPYRAAESIWVGEPDEDDRFLLELERGAHAFTIVRHFYNLAGDAVLVHERQLRADRVLRYDRNLPWESFLRDVFGDEVRESGGGR